MCSVCGRLFFISCVLKEMFCAAEGQCVFCLFGKGGFPISFMLYSLLCSMFLMVFISVYFAL
jgi:hypothetical protein